MTENGTFKKAVRARVARTGERYTEARRNLLAEEATRAAGIEPHYRFVPPWTIEYVDADGRRELPLPPDLASAFSWGYAGSGPSTSSYAVLLDATGSADWTLAMGFTTDNLGWPDLDQEEFAITAAEVRAWRRENEQKVRARAAADAGRTWTATELAADAAAYLSSDDSPRGPWWRTYRELHGEPRLS